MRISRHFASLFIASALATPAAQAQIKCWTNSEGVRECGNVVPPEYARERTETINRRGMTIEVKERAKTPEEIAAERQRNEEERAAQEIEERRLIEQRRYDRMLLSVFTSEEEIIASRDQKLEALDGTIEINRSSLEKLRVKLEEHRSRAASLERAGKPLPEALQEDIASAESAVADKEHYIAGKLEEKERLREQADSDRARFRELKSVSP